MRVICIDGTFFFLENGEQCKNCPKEGQIYNVSDNMTLGDTHYYELREFKEQWWEAAAFVPTSENDETERIEEILDSMFVPVEAKPILNNKLNTKQ